MNTKMILIAAIAACGLSAQINVKTIRTAVPFAFDAKGQQMPAGKYEVIRNSEHGYLTLRNMETGKRIVMTAGVTGDNKDNSNALEFKRYGDTFFLSAVEFQSSGRKISVMTSRREKEMASTARPEIVLARAE
jgi:hypothetical protein